MKWSEFYEKYWDWSDTTRRTRISSLEDVGPGAEVVEVIFEIQDQKVRSQLIRKALKLGACFTADDLVELEYEIPDALFAQLAEYAGLDKDNPHLDENHMTWSDFYNSYCDWSQEVLTRRVNLLNDIGPTDEIIEVFQTIALDDEKLAVQLIKKVIGAGVKFSGEQISELILTCDNAMLEQIILASADSFTTQDLDDLYACYDDKLLVDIALKHHIKLPECLSDYEIKEFGHLTFEGLVAEYDYILECLKIARNHLEEAHNYSLWDISRTRREWCVLKYSCVEAAQASITDAIDTWNRLEFPGKDKSLFPKVFPFISTSDMWQDFWIKGFWVELIAERRIKKLQKTTDQAIRAIQIARKAIL